VSRLLCSRLRVSLNVAAPAGRVVIPLRRLLDRFVGGLGGGVFVSAKPFRQWLVEFLKIFYDRCWCVRRGDAVGKSLAA
jgi:hypothetical protein